MDAYFLVLERLFNCGLWTSGMGLGLTLLNLDTATARFVGNISSGRLCDV